MEETENTTNEEEFDNKSISIQPTSLQPQLYDYSFLTRTFMLAGEFTRQHRIENLKEFQKLKQIHERNQ